MQARAPRTSTLSDVGGCPACARFPADAPRGVRLPDKPRGAGGLLSGLPVRSGAKVAGIDRSRCNVSVARRHAAPQGVAADCRPAEAARTLDPERAFDSVLAPEVVGHVGDVAVFAGAVARQVAPGARPAASTIDRACKCSSFAIVGAQDLLRVLPRGSRRWRRCVPPAGPAAAAACAGRLPIDLRRMRARPPGHRASWRRDTRAHDGATLVRAAG